MASFTSRLIIIVLALSAIVDASRILGVFPHPVYSHQLGFRHLTLELARRGHELIVFTTDPMNEPNLRLQYTEVDLHYLYDYTMSKIDFYSKAKLGIWSFVHEIYKHNENITDGTLSHPVMQRLISPNSTAKFDLIIVQNLFYDGLYALSIRFNAPLVVISMMSLSANHNYALGNPLLTSTSPDVLLGYDDDMNLWQRFVNLYYQLRQIYGYKYIVLPIQERISRKHFGDSIPPIHQLNSRISLILVNSHPFFTYPRADIPAIVYIGGFRVDRQKKKLPQDLDKLLNDTKEGCIYFSLGTNIKSNILPIDRRNMLLKTFAALPYKVLWKFESDYLANKPDNVEIRKWFPQQKVLAHPNVRLFISHGGLNSIDETIENAVPVIGFPVSIDQNFNMRRLQHFGVGKILSITDVNEEEFREAILEMITNSSYKENMVKLSNLFRDLPHKPLDNAIWWIEHVIRHKGASHLHNKSQDLAWYQNQMLDVMAIALGTIALIIYIIIVIIRYLSNIFRFYSMRARTKHDSKKQN
ncbi:UDP-glucuronosyltransferase 2C1-like [Odontomachus brunneus]|uniref:UDP-glucuronosyltransferase 2C1-like n=1 Tax=Odontomachus brunneus TaxID=486640 RepID=UPI0013F1FA41|nr:UDP-glucuronosyltransferase 2C1-like [Odontomachus brunneus]